jgi:hypothetical protein
MEILWVACRLLEHSSGARCTCVMLHGMHARGGMWSGLACISGLFGCVCVVLFVWCCVCGGAVCVAYKENVGVLLHGMQAKYGLRHMTVLLDLGPGGPLIVCAAECAVLSQQQLGCTAAVWRASWKSWRWS